MADLNKAVVWKVPTGSLISYSSSSFNYLGIVPRAAFTISITVNYIYHFYFKLFKQLFIMIQFSVSTVSMSKTVLFQIIQFSISTQFKCK